MLSLSDRELSGIASSLKLGLHFRFPLPFLIICFHFCLFSALSEFMFVKRDCYRKERENEKTRHKWKTEILVSFLMPLSLLWLFRGPKCLQSENSADGSECWLCDRRRGGLSAVWQSTERSESNVISHCMLCLSAITEQNEGHKWRAWVVHAALK